MNFLKTVYHLGEFTVQKVLVRFMTQLLLKSGNKTTLEPGPEVLGSLV